MPDSKLGVAPIVRLMEGMKQDPLTGCWDWQGRPNYEGGYGRMSLRGKQYFVHRISYTLHVGPIPDGMEIDHLCRNRMCVNPSHLEAVTGRVNTYRGQGPSAINSRKTHCIRGHELVPGNLYKAANKRLCKACGRLRERERYQRRSSAANPVDA